MKLQVQHYVTANSTGGYLLSLSLVLVFILHRRTPTNSCNLLYLSYYFRELNQERISVILTLAG